MDSMTLLRILIVSLLLLVAFADIAMARPRRYLLTLFFAGVALLVFAATVPDNIQTKGGLADAIAITVGFLTTVLGMVSEYFYAQTLQRRKKFKFDAVSFLAPILASPIVFMPLFTMFADIDFSGPFTRAKFMVYLVAFQNGFFWRSFFEDRRKKALETVPGQVALPHENARPVGSRVAISG